MRFDPSQSDSLRRIVRSTPAIAFRGTALDSRAFFVIVPRSDYQKWNWIIGGIRFARNLHRVRQRFAAALRDVSAQAPGRLPVVETRPCRTDRNLLRILRLHCLIEIAEIVLAPMTSVGCPTLFPGIDPCVET